MPMHRREGPGADRYLPVCVQGGRRKVTYRTKAEAKRLARSGQLTGAQRAYHCRECGFYHLTSQPR